MNTLVITDLSKSFGNNKVLNNISLSIKEGSILGFIGENGAGKTTTMKSILGLIKPDSGSIHVCGKLVEYGQNTTNKMIGYLPDVPSFYGYMNPIEYLTLCGKVSGLNKETIKTRSSQLLEIVGLSKYNKKISGFSRGMKQRLGIAQALLSEPKLLICDEPTSALDPAGRKAILDILESIKGKTTVIFSTHVLSDVENVCDTVAMLHNGKIVLSGSLSEIKHINNSNILNIEFYNIETSRKFHNILNSNNIYHNINNTVVTIKTNSISDTEGKILSLLSEYKLLPLKLEIMEPTLESLFLEVIK